MATTSEVKITWHAAKTGNHQGLIISDIDGANIAVAYDKANAPLIAAAPEMADTLFDIMAECDEWLDGNTDLSAEDLAMAIRRVARQCHDKATSGE